MIERISVCAGNRPINSEKLFYRGAHVRFVTRLVRRAPGEPRDAEV